jgi:hypothetical protein
MTHFLDSFSKMNFGSGGGGEDVVVTVEMVKLPKNVPIYIAKRLFFIQS